MDSNIGAIYQTEQPVDEYWQRLVWSRYRCPSYRKEADAGCCLVGGQPYSCRRNWQTECVYEITPTTAMDSFTIDGHTIRSCMQTERSTSMVVKKFIQIQSRINIGLCTLKQNSFLHWIQKSKYQYERYVCKVVLNIHRFFV